MLALGRRDKRIIEFGASLGVSTTYLAAAIRDAGGGTLTTTERHPAKVEKARRNLAQAGLDDLVELRVGDALQTLDSLVGPVDLLFLDGSNDLYLQVLMLVEPCLGANGLLVADLSADDPDLLPYLEHVRDAVNGYVSIEVPLGARVEVSARIHDGMTHTSASFRSAQPTSSRCGSALPVLRGQQAITRLPL